MNPPTPPIESLLGELLIRAAFFRHLASFVAAPRDGHKERIVEGFNSFDERSGPVQAGEEQRSAFAAARAAWATADPARLATMYVRHFLLNGPCPLNETAYGDSRRMAGREAELADINGFYRAFGMDLSPSDTDLPDHLATELEFYSLLILKTAYAESQGLEEKAGIARDAARAFLADHLGRWPPALRQALEENNAESPYPESIRLIEIAVAAECASMGASPVPFSGRKPFDPSEAETFTCPAACPAKEVRT